MKNIIAFLFMAVLFVAGPMLPHESLGKHTGSFSAFDGTCLSDDAVLSQTPLSLLQPRTNEKTPVRANLPAIIEQQGSSLHQPWDATSLENSPLHRLPADRNIRSISFKLPAFAFSEKQHKASKESKAACQPNTMQANHLETLVCLQRIAEAPKASAPDAIWWLPSKGSAPPSVL